MSRNDKRGTGRKPYPMLVKLPTYQVWLLGALGALAVIVIWQLGYSRTIFVPPPMDVVKVFFEVLAESETWSVLGTSAMRLAAGLGIGIVFGILAAIVAGEREDLRRMINVYVQIAFTLPSLLVALLALVIFGISEVGVILAVAIIVFPFVTSPVMEGVKSLDRNILAMAKVYGIPRTQRLRDIVLPHVAPFLFGGIRNGHALGWRVLIVAEIFSVRSGLGFKFERAFALFQFDQLMVYLVLMLAVIFAVEYCILKPLEDRSARWRMSGRKTAKSRLPGLRNNTAQRVDSHV